MIRPLRRVHPFLVATIGLVAATVAVLGLRGRSAVPTTEAPPPLAAPGDVDSGPRSAAWTLLLSDPPLSVRADREGLLVRTVGDLEEPEPRLYWLPAAARAEAGARVPDDAVPLGGIRGRGLERLPPLPPGSGRLVLTALGPPERVLGAAEIEAPDPPGGDDPTPETAAETGEPS